jgi:transketolase N-terminal domain/subunit
MVTIMTALWFTELTADDRVSVKPHASPVLHAINSLLGELSPAQLGTLRAFKGLQSYPSRSKDPDTVDYSTGSVGIGATAPLWGAIARRYVAHTTRMPRQAGRQFSLVGDAELDEGAVWEAVLDPMIADLGEIVWIVDFNRQSLDRVVPNISAMFYHLYVLIDIYSRFSPGWIVSTVEESHLAANFLADANARNGAIPHTVQADRGTSMTSKPVSAFLADLGMARSHSRPRVSNDNPHSEAQFRTLKYLPEFPDHFKFSCHWSMRNDLWPGSSTRIAIVTAIPGLVGTPRHRFTSAPPGRSTRRGSRR